MFARLMAGVLLALLTPATPVHAQANGSADGPRPGYLLVMGTPTNLEAIGRYARTLPPIYQKFGGVYLAAGGVGRGITVLEGEFAAQSIIFAKFPSLERPNEFWWSPEYRASVRLREGAGRFDVIKLPGMPGNMPAPAGKPAPISKPAYLISIAEVEDRAKLQPYAAAALPLVRAAGASFVAVGSRKDIEALEGDFGNLNVTILQFPSMAALRAFYDDPAYRQIIPLRQSAGTYTVLAVEGYEPRSASPAPGP